MFKSVFLFTMIFTTALHAQNPIFPEGTYIADPTARVWPDGKIYIYGSTDESRNYWCSYAHDVLYSDNLLDWKKVSNVFASKGKNDSLPQGDPLLFAPDAIYRNGKYYLYFCTPDTTMSEGVSVSDKPTGPFGNAQLLNTGKYKEIDPTVFIDDDGQAYYYWGQYNLKGAKLNADLRSLDTSSLVENLLTRKQHFFHEGSFVFKRNETYYVVFADESRRDRRPSCLGYATASSPMGPFTYRGVIIDNYHCDPESWNNHGSLAEFKGQWYIFYHRSSQGSQVMRRTCIEPVYFDAQGLIREVEMTSQGAGRPLSAFSAIEARRACFLSGYCRIRSQGKMMGVLGDIKHGDQAAFKYIDFGKGVTKFFITAYSQTGGTILLRENNSGGRIIGKIVIPAPAAGSKPEYQVYQAGIKGTTGVKALWMEFNGSPNGERLFSIEKYWFG